MVIVEGKAGKMESRLSVGRLARNQATTKPHCELTLLLLLLLLLLCFTTA